MPKNIDDVILPERRRSIRNIPIPEGRRKSDVRYSASSSKVALDGVKRSSVRVVPPPPPEEISHSAKTHSRRLRPRYWMIVAGSFIVLILAILTLFKGSTVSYVPRSALLSFSEETYPAYKTGGEGLLFSVVKLSSDKSVVVKATGESDVERKASGTIIVYNTSSEAQKLIENTRFQSVEGRIYRISQAITIPAKSGTTPGSLEVRVTADVAGPAYNTGLTDFTVPGLKGTARYESVYGRSKTPMVGGFVGKERTAEQGDVAKAKSDLEEALRQELFTKAESEVPSDFIFLPSLSSVAFEELVSTSSSDSSGVSLSLKGSLYGLMFKRSDLALVLAKDKVSLNEGDLVELESLDSLQISFAGNPGDILSLNQVSLKVSGSATLVFRVDEVSLKSDLSGKKKGEFDNVLKNYPSIESAKYSLSPFWKTRFPESDEITVRRAKSL